MTTYYFIRHAEKVRGNPTDKNPDLNEIGKKRAEYWNTVFKNVAFDEIYSTNFNRTLQTAAPMAKTKNLEVKIYHPESLYNDDFQLKTKGKTVLVVGHSNTTPLFVNKILGREMYPEIDDTNNSNLYIITISDTVMDNVLLVIDL
ncbi:MAG: phosphoglycerate mutase family protein [Lutibacter sp.]|nr:phosphoglycerate mutase family protein [Lutibacter sp.]